VHPSEIMTVLTHFQQSRYRHFKVYYTQYVQVYLRREFSTLTSPDAYPELTLHHVNQRFR
jgi:hypothetical protein